MSIGWFYPSSLVFAQQATEAKTYQNYPVGMQILQAGYMRQTTNTTVDGSVTLPNKNIDINVNGYFLRYVNFFQIGKVGAGVQAVLPLIHIDASILGVKARNTGIGDAVIAFGTTLVGMSPPPSFKQFLVAPKTFCLGWAVMVTAPTGSYSRDVLLNPGGNRWQIRPELGMSIPKGKWDLEASASLRFFTRNDGLPALRPGQPSVVLSQRPMVGMTTHAVYNMHPKFWISLDLAGRLGGQTRKDNIWQEDAQALLAMGSTATFTPQPHHSIGLGYITQALRNEFAPEGHIFTLKYSYLFGREMNQTLRTLKANHK